MGYFQNSTGRVVNTSVTAATQFLVGGHTHHAEDASDDLPLLRNDGRSRLNTSPFPQSVFMTYDDNQPGVLRPERAFDNDT